MLVKTRCGDSLYRNGDDGFRTIVCQIRPSGPISFSTNVGVDCHGLFVVADEESCLVRSLFVVRFADVFGGGGALFAGQQ